MNDIRKQIGQRIKARREYIEMTQGQVATRLGVKPSTVSLYESGSRALAAEDIEKLARILRVTSAYFYDDEQTLEEADFNRYYRGAPPILQKAARDMLRGAFVEDDAEEVTHGKRAEE